jgi:hypothetical protein
LPSLLLVIVALHQIWLARTEALSPWSGGGFGMFSTTDAGPTRHLHALLVRPGLLRSVVPPPELEGLTRRALALPSESHLRDLALALADTPTPDPGPATAVRVQVWHVQHEPHTLAPRGRLLRAIEVPIGPD